MRTVITIFVGLTLTVLFVGCSSEEVSPSGSGQSIPGDAEDYFNRGLAYYKKGEHDRAISDYDRAIEINPRYAGAYYNKALACEKDGRTKEAIEAYKGFIQCAPSQYARQIEHARERIRELEE